MKLNNRRLDVGPDGSAMNMDPGIDGLNTYKKMLELRPFQKAIIAIGFSERGRVTEVQTLGTGKYIRKS